MKEIYEILLMLDQTGAAYLIFLLGFLLMADYCFTAQAEVIRLRKLLKQAMRSTTKEVDTVAEIVEIAINSDNPEIFASVCRLLIDGLVILANTSSDEGHKERFVQLVVKHMRDELEITQKQ